MPPHKPLHMPPHKHEDRFLVIHHPPVQIDLRIVYME